jgi:hypothetical protein
MSSRPEKIGEADVPLRETFWLDALPPALILNRSFLALWWTFDPRDPLDFEAKN